jgi:hypothetical protein
VGSQRPDDLTTRTYRLEVAGFKHREVTAMPQKNNKPREIVIRYVSGVGVDTPEGMDRFIEILAEMVYEWLKAEGYLRKDADLSKLLGSDDSVDPDDS